MSDVNWKDEYDAVRSDRDGYAEELKKLKREYHLLQKETISAETLLRCIIQSGWKPSTREEFTLLDELTLSIGGVLIG